VDPPHTPTHPPSTNPVDPITQGLILWLDYEKEMKFKIITPSHKILQQDLVVGRGWLLLNFISFS
jgi:hypothetical protein